MITKAIYSYWTYPLFNMDRFHDTSKMWTMYDLAAFWMLSTNQASKQFKDIVIYTDEDGYKFLSKLNLPVTSIEIIYHDDIAPKWLWAYGKLLSVALQTDPFIQLDFDVFLSKQLPKELLESRLVIQSEEDEGIFMSEYYHQVNDFDLCESSKSITGWTSKWINDKDYRKSYNCGIFGGNDIEFIQEYAINSIEFAKILASDKFSQKMYQEYNILFEQYYLYQICKFRNVVPYILLDTAKDVQSQCTNLGYTHLLAASKFDPVNVAKVLNRLKNNSPQSFKLLNSLYSISTSKGYYEFDDTRAKWYEIW